MEHRILIAHHSELLTSHVETKHFHTTVLLSPHRLFHSLSRHISCFLRPLRRHCERGTERLFPDEAFSSSRVEDSIPLVIDHEALRVQVQERATLDSRVFRTGTPLYVDTPSPAEPTESPVCARRRRRHKRGCARVRQVHRRRFAAQSPTSAIKYLLLKTPRGPDERDSTTFIERTGPPPCFPWIPSPRITTKSVKPPTKRNVLRSCKNSRSRHRHRRRRRHKQHKRQHNPKISHKPCSSDRRFHGPCLAVFWATSSKDS